MVALMSDKPKHIAKVVDDLVAEGLAFDPYASAFDMLKPRQRFFVLEYMRNGGNAIQAAHDVGSPKPERDGPKWIGFSSIQNALHYLERKVEKEILLDVNWVRERLKIEAEGQGEDTSSAARVSAIKQAMELPENQSWKQAKETNMKVEVTFVNRPSLGGQPPMAIEKPPSKALPETIIEAETDEVIQGT